MSERDILLRWLDGAAARVRLGAWLRHALTLVCALLALLAVHEGLRALIPAPEVLAALLPLFLLAATGAAVVCVLALWRPANLTQAAAAADARAGLKDELRSALWFTQASGGGPLVGPLLAHASRTVQALDAGRLFPLTVPRPVLAALGFTLLALALTRVPLASFPAGKAGPAAPVTPEASVLPPQGHDAPRAAQDRISTAPGSARTQAAWSRLLELAGALAGEAEGQAIGQAIAARDAHRAAQLLQALQARQAAQPTPGRAARPETEQMSAALAEGILARLRDLMQEPAAQSDSAADTADAPTAHLTEELRADSPPEKGDPAGQQSAGETVLNEMLRAINRSSIGGRDVAGGAGEAAQEGSGANVGGGAMGRRVGASRAGGADGEPPPANPAGTADSEPVLGDKTVRLDAQLQKVKVEASPDEDQPGAEDALYAATRAQAAGLGYEAVAARPRQAAEEAVSGERTPLTYRDAVKHYTLGQHAKQRPPAP